MSKEKTQRILQKYKKQKKKRERERILSTIVCQQIRQPRRNGQLSRDLQPGNTEPRRNRSPEHSNH